MKPNLQLNLLISLIVCISNVSAHTNRLQNRAKIIEKINPTPNFEAYRLNGLKVSLPHVNGLEFFGFHANLNKPIFLRDTGEYHTDVTAPENGEWTFHNKVINLRVGDVLNYWISIKLDGEQLLFPKKRYVVTEFKKSASDLIPEKHFCSACGNYNQNENNIPTTSLPNFQMCKCNQTYLNSLENKIQILEGQFKSLNELVNDFIKDLNIGTELILTCQKNENLSALDVVRNVISNELNLPDLAQKVLKAQYISNGIIFKISSSIEKKRILIRSATVLPNTKYTIIDVEVGSDGTGFIFDDANDNNKNNTILTKTTTVTTTTISVENPNGDQIIMTEEELKKAGLSDILDMDVRIGSTLIGKRLNTEPSSSKT